MIALEQFSKNEAEPEFVPNDNEEQVNLEHVLPKRAKQTDWGASFSADERKEYVHRIGNLALLQKGPNGRIGNKGIFREEGGAQCIGFQTNEGDRDRDGVDQADDRNSSGTLSGSGGEGVAAIRLLTKLHN